MHQTLGTDTGPRRELRTCVASGVLFAAAVVELFLPLLGDRAGPDMVASRRVRRLGCAGAVALLLVLGAACGREPRQPAGRLPDTPPWGLDTVVLPQDEASLVGVLEALPVRVAGYERSSAPIIPEIEGNPITVTYGNGDRLTYPDGNGGAMLAFPADGDVASGFRNFIHNMGARVEAQDLEPGRDLVYLVATFQDAPMGVPPRDVFIAMWGSPGSPWVFEAMAESPEVREALAKSFVETVRGTADA